MTAPTTETTKTVTWTGQSLPRKEDERLLKAQGSFVDDEGMHRMGFAEYVRSPYGHARIVSIDVSKAAAMPGVITTLTGDAPFSPLISFTRTKPFFVSQSCLSPRARSVTSAPDL